MRIALRENEKPNRSDAKIHPQLYYFWSTISVPELLKQKLRRTSNIQDE